MTITSRREQIREMKRRIAEEKEAFIVSLKNEESLKLENIARDHILKVLEMCDGNRTHAAFCLGISLRCLKMKIAIYEGEGIDVIPPKTGRRKD